MRTILLIGAKGMLAHAIIRRLQASGRDFIGIDLPECDITRPEDIRRVFQEHRPELAINCAAHTKVDLCEQQEELANAINGHAVRCLAENAGRAGTRLVHISTDFVFDGKSTRPYRPEDPTGPLSAYGRSKLLGEKFLQEVNPPGWIIARTAWLYGPNGLSFPRTMVERARQSLPLKVVNDQLGSPTFTFDLAEALLTLADNNASGIFHVTNSGQTNWFEFAKATLDEFKLKTDLQPTSTAEFFKARPNQAVRPAYSVLDGGRYAAIAGKPMRPWRLALADFARQGSV